MSDITQDKIDLLNLMLSVAVSLHIAEIKAAGGPSDEEIALCQQVYASRLSEASPGYWNTDAHGKQTSWVAFTSSPEHLWHKDGKPGDTARQFNRLAHALAIMAFQPGGVMLYGQAYLAPRLMPLTQRQYEWKRRDLTNHAPQTRRLMRKRQRRQ